VELESAHELGPRSVNFSLAQQLGSEMTQMRRQPPSF